VSASSCLGVVLLAAGTLMACAAAPPPPDQTCLGLLRAQGVAFTEGPDLKGVRTPVTLDGGRFTPRLLPRGRRPAEMDCQLAVALVQARPIFRNLGITDMEYSGAYDFRNRRGTSKLSAHAAGLAIDVHVFHEGDRKLAVARAFEKSPGRWRSTDAGRSGLRGCVGDPRTASGRTLRTLACRLRLDQAFREIITPDDNWDHRDHFHLEARPDLASWVTLPPPLPAGNNS
jgi:hypothetical protein